MHFALNRALGEPPARAATRQQGLRAFVLCLFVSAVCAADAPPAVRLARLPAGGIQPQAVTDRDGTAHLVYFQGEPLAGDLFYVRWRPETASFTPPVRVNHRPRTAVAVGPVRGAQLAAGRRGRLHVVWNGSGEVKAEGHDGAPLWYTRSTDAGGFEPERDVIRKTGALDGGGSVAADARGNVCW
jgi:hypothetical protein